MSHDSLPLDQRSIRGTDSNTLLRMYDQATGILKGSPSQQERAKADKAIERIARELRTRNVHL